MIPKIIHYCWFGSREMGDLEKSCFDSWHNLMPNFLIRCWNEESLDLTQYPFAWDAYQKGKFAFVSDVIRLHALVNEGGIYLDTDILVLKSFDSLLEQDFFVGEYKKDSLNAAVVGSVAGYPLLNELLDFYQNQNFDFLKPLTIPGVFDQFIWNHALPSGTIYPTEYFYPLPLEQKTADYSKFLTTNSYCVHLWNHSWKDEFMLLKEYHFIDSLKVNFKHCREIPAIYLTKSHQTKYFKIFYLRFKNWIYQSLYGPQKSS